MRLVKGAGVYCRSRAVFLPPVDCLDVPTPDAASTLTDSHVRLRQHSLMQIRLDCAFFIPSFCAIWLAERQFFIAISPGSPG